MLLDGRCCRCASGLSRCCCSDLVPVRTKAAPGGVADERRLELAYVAEDFCDSEYRPESPKVGLCC